MEPRTLAPNARAAVFTAVCTLLAVAAHRSMAAPAIPAFAVALGAAAVFCFARVAASLGERGLGVIALLVGGSQLGLHLLFQAAQAGANPMPGMASMPSGHGTSGMTIAHGLAAIVTAWWLRQGEAALFAAAERARAVLGASWRMVAWWAGGAEPRPVLSLGPAMRRFGHGAGQPTAVLLLLFTVIRRGPPAATCR